ncbi:MAG: 50S ribosomal protein L4 [Candidatus Dojkabacteria bacterium]|jgi:large subunit ribosomal protein L4
MEKKEVKKTKKEEKKVEQKLNPAVWEVPYNADLLAQVLYVYRNNERKATANVKSRSEVSGGGKKPWRQKGTGRARHGSSRSPIWVGGGVTFGNVSDKNYSRKLNKKMIRKAVCIMLSERLRKEQLQFVNSTEKSAENIRKEAKEDKKKILMISNNEDLSKKIRNSEKAKVITAEKVNAKHLITSNLVYVDNEIVDILEKRLTNGK